MNRISTLLLLVLGLLVTLAACPPPAGNLDDDDATSAQDDDDTTPSDDDDDSAADDDDFTIPPGIGLGGTIEYTPLAGEVPAGAVRMGLFTTTDELLPDEERWSQQVTEGGLIGGDTIYTVYVDGDPPAGDLLDTQAGFEVALYVPFAYVDSNADGSYGQGDPLLGAGDVLFAWITFEGDPPDYLVAAGGGLGWNIVDWADVVDGDDELEFEHTPEGTNSSNGPEVSVELLPVTGGTVPLATDVLHPTGSVVIGLHSSMLGGIPVEDPQMFSMPVSNGELRGAELLVDWPVSGAPPAHHLSEMDGGLGALSAFYLVVGYYDDGDEVLTIGTCDTLLSFGSPRLLMWVDPGSLTLAAGFRAQAYDVPIGWSLFDQALNTWRLLAAGMNLVTITELGSGDDDDSAGDDDDSSGSGPGFDGVIPAECVPGDDDDSAADDDDSASTPS